MPRIDGPITPAEMASLMPDARWSDGRTGYLWCRFDALLDRERRLRAEVTWDDDAEFEDNATGEPTVYFDAELFLETNRPEMPDGETPWITWDGIAIPLARERAIALVMNDPAAILEAYAGEIAELEVWTPADGHGPRSRGHAPT
jgi:hypothetical protein